MKGRGLNTSPFLNKFAYENILIFTRNNFSIDLKTPSSLAGKK